MNDRRSRIAALVIFPHLPTHSCTKLPHTILLCPLLEQLSFTTKLSYAVLLCMPYQHLIILRNHGPKVIYKSISLFLANIYTCICFPRSVRILPARLLKMRRCPISALLKPSGPTCERNFSAQFDEGEFGTASIHLLRHSNSREVLNIASTFEEFFGPLKDWHEFSPCVTQYTLQELKCIDLQKFARKNRHEYQLSVAI